MSKPTYEELEKLVKELKRTETERKKAEQQTSFEQSFTNLLLTNIPDYFYFKDKERRFIRASNYFCDLLNLKMEDIIGKKDDDLFPKELAELTSKQEQQIIETGKPLINHLETAYDKWVLTSKLPWYDPEGNIIGLFGFSKDVTELKKVEDELRKYKTIMDISNYGAAIADVEGNVIYSNRTWANMHGYTTEEFTGKHFSICHSPEQFKHVMELNVRLVKEGSFFAEEVEHTKKDGGVFTTLMNCVAMKNDDGKPLYFSMSAIDITDRKKSDQAIKKSEEEYQSLFNSMREGFALCEVVCDKKGNPIDYRFLKINPAFGEQSGMAIQRSLGRTIKEIFPDIEPIWIERYGRVAITQEPIDFEDYNHNTGKYYNARAFSLEKGRFAMMFKDITEKKKAELALKESEEKFRTFMETASDLMFITDEKYHLNYVNKAMADTLGYTKEELIGMNITQIKKETSQERSSAEMNVLISEGELSSEDIFITKDGKNIYGNSKFVAVYDDKSCFIGSRAIFRDLTQHKYLKEQLQIRQRMDSLGTLAGGIAHDFNNLLVGIMGNIDMLNLESEGFTEFQKECLKNADISCERAASIIGQFQMLSRGAVSEKVNVDVYEIAKEIFGILGQTTDKLIKKRIDLSKGKLFIKASPTELNQVFMNIGTNAVHAIEERGVKRGDYFSVRAEDCSIAGTDTTGLPKGEYVHIIFEDNGVGMSDEVKRQAFDPLFTTKGKGTKKGQGLGLAMVYNIITRNHNGHIAIESSKGVGTTFHIYLPKAHARTQKISEAISDIAGGNETILIIEDEEIVSTFAKSVLNKYGYNILLAEDGQKGLDTYIKNRDSIDLVILDLTMPEMAGQMAFEELLKFDNKVKVIISSVHSEEETRKGILSLAKGYVNKPYRMRELAQAVRTVMDA